MTEILDIIKAFLISLNVPVHVVQTIILLSFMGFLFVIIFPYLKALLKYAADAYKKITSLLSITGEFKNNGGSTIRDKIDTICDKLISVEEAITLIDGKMTTIMTIIGENTNAPGLYETTADGKCVFVTKRWSEITGLSYEDALGNGWMSCIHPEDLENVLAGWKTCTENCIKFDMYYRVVNNGKAIKVHGYTIPIKNKKRDVVRYIGAIIPQT